MSNYLFIFLLGDVDQKPFVTAVPDIRKIALDGGEDFLILACDGLWDHLSEDDAAKTVYNMVIQNPGIYLVNWVLL